MYMQGLETGRGRRSSLGDTETERESRLRRVSTASRVNKGLGLKKHNDNINKDISERGKSGKKRWAECDRSGIVYSATVLL